jgi:hypothetical protein
MVIIQKIDHRKKRERRVFFSLKIIPFFILFVMIMLLILDSTVQKKNLSGEVVSNVFLIQQEYNMSKPLQGLARIGFVQNDFLPLNTTVLINLPGGCPAYYVCEDGTEVLWVDENCTEVDPEPYLCDGSYVVRNCSRYDKECCPSSGVSGKNYRNLACLNVPGYLSDYFSGDGTGFCGDSCSPLFKKDLSYFIERSATSMKGNFTNGTYKNNGNSSIFLGLSGPGVGFCFNNSTDIEKYGYNVSYSSPSCNDSDGNASWIPNVCYDLRGAWNDTCSLFGSGNSLPLNERYCKQGDKVASSPPLHCGNFKCLDPACYNNATGSYWTSMCVIAMDMQGYTRTFITKTDYNCSGLNGSQVGPKCNTATGNWTLSPYCANESIPCMACSGEPGMCSGLASSTVNCTGWGNFYEASLQNLAINSPSVGGTYLLIFALSWNNSVFNSTYSRFSVYPRHKECVNYVCKLVDGFGDNECDDTSDCLNETCTPSWSCTDFSACANGKQYKTCTDVNDCGISTGKPLEEQDCGCNPSWSCAWQNCSVGILQNYVCFDTVNCNPNNSSYVAQSRECCVDEWTCGKWSKCSNNLQTRDCVEATGCGTSFYKPELQRTCNPQLSPWIILIIVVVVIVVGFLVWLLFLRKKMMRDRFVGTGYGNFESNERYSPDEGNRSSFSERPAKRMNTRQQYAEEERQIMGQSKGYQQEYAEEPARPVRREPSREYGYEQTSFEERPARRVERRPQPREYKQEEEEQYSEPARRPVRRAERRFSEQPEKPARRSESDYGPSLDPREYSQEMEKLRKRVAKKKEIKEEDYSDSIPDAPQ